MLFWLPFISAVVLQIRQTESYVRCHSQKADVLYILDGSGSVSYPDWKLELAFVNRLNRHFTINKRHVQVSVTVFGSYVKRAISFTQYNGNPRRLRKAIRRLKKAHGNTNTAAALKDARKFSFTDDNGARHNVVKLAVLITGGASVNSQDTLKAARKLKESGVITIAVGAGSGTNNTELEGIASSPKHVFTVHKFRSLRKLRHKILKRLCRA